MKLSPSELTALEALLSEREVDHVTLSTTEVADKWYAGPEVEDLVGVQHLTAAMRKHAASGLYHPEATHYVMFCIGLVVGRRLAEAMAESRQLEGMLK